MRKQDEEIVNGKNRQEWLDLIFQWVHSELDRKMLERYLLDGLSIEQVAEDVNLSTVQAQKRLKNAKTQLFSHI